ncbi:MAG: hypothetical protein RLZZ543_327 [Bacteroidota bacterium]|jgi:PKD repeat protein
MWLHDGRKKFEVFFNKRAKKSNAFLILFHLFISKLRALNFNGEMKKLLTLILGTMLITSSFAQQPTTRRCGSMEVDARLKAEDPGYAARRAEINAHAAIFSNNMNAERTLVTIPVVFHVVYNNNSENISDAALQSQLDILNEDFRKLNADFSTVPAAFQGVGADFEIQFCLANVDPSGATTTGITRTQTSITSFTDDDKAKYTSQGGHDIWNRNKYLNLWVCDLSTQGLLGYAQFPGGPAATDGVVLDYKSVGRPPYNNFGGAYNLGRTATHEIGHWLNLYHIWGDDSAQSPCQGSDQVNDTPNQAQANYGCKTFPYTTSCASTSPGEMFMNYMDYGDDDCLKMFTAGQKARAQALFATGGSRVSLLTSNVCTVEPPTPPAACSDTLNFPLNGTVILPTAGTGQTGYVSGVNSYGDLAKADLFSATAPLTQLTGAGFTFGAATQGTAPAGTTITVKAYAYTASGPSTVLGSTTIPLSTIISNVNSGATTWVNFSSPITVSGNFFLGFEVNPTAGYTLGLKTNSDGDPVSNAAWELMSDNTWHQFTESPASWGISVNQAIYPILTAVQPVASFTTNTTSICAGQTVSYTAQAGGASYAWTFTGGSPSTSTAQNPTVTYNNSGNYGASLVVTGVCAGQSATQTQNSLITVGQTPAQPILNLVGTVLTSGVSVGTFQWYLGGVAISGATASTFTPTLPGVYTVTVTIGNCTKTSAGLSYTPTGISSVAGDMNVLVYPNPAKDQLTIEANFATSQSHVDCRLYDLSGKLVFQRTFEQVQPDAKLQIALSDISNGMYQLILTTENGRSVNRVAIAH